MNQTRWIAPLLALALLVACGAERSDEAISEDFARLAEAEPVLADTDIRAMTDDGRITLRGTVPSEHARESAEDLAAEIEGVKDVRSELRVFAPAPAPPRPRIPGANAPEAINPPADERVLPPSIEPEPGDLAPSPDVPPDPMSER
jgi:hypothetical protein